MTSTTTSPPSSPTVGNTAHITVITEKDGILLKERVIKRQECQNGVIKNVNDLATPKKISHCESGNSPRKNVCTVFSSNHRKSWQCSLSNYSQEPAGETRSRRSLHRQHESYELQATSRVTWPSSDQAEHNGHGDSKVVVNSSHSCDGSGRTDDQPVASPSLAAEQNQDGVVEFENGACEPNVGHRSSFPDVASNDSSLSLGKGDSNEGKGHVDLTSSPGLVHDQHCVQDPVLTWSCQQEPHLLRHHSTASSTGQDCLELSVYRSNSPQNPVLDSPTPRDDQTRSASTNQMQTVCLLRTTDQSETLSVNSYDKRKRPAGSVSIRHSWDPHKHAALSKRLSQATNYGYAERGRQKNTLPGDCPSDTQPLIPGSTVRVDDASCSGSPVMCADNVLVRFHSLDSRDSSSKADDAADRTPPYMPRAVSMHAGPMLSVLDTCSLTVEGPSATGAGSPVGSDSRAAPALSDLYRYHVFLSHCAQDAGWARDVAERLRAPPYTYSCTYSPHVQQDQTALEQSLLCSAMLSERVVLVLSRQYVKDTWFVFERVLRQLTQMSLHNQRIMGVLLEDCEIPDTLGELYFLDTSDPDFFDVFTKRLKTGRIPRSSESVSSDLAGRTSVATPSVVNGQTLAQCPLVIKAGWDSFLQVAETSEDLPPSLKSHGINLEKTEFYAIVHNVCLVAQGSNQLPWVLSIQPLLVLLVVSTLWFPAFVAVLAMHVDDNSGMALPVRLVVFVFPLIVVSCGYLLKWRRRYWIAKVVRMLIHNCVKANQLLYCEGRPVLTTAGHVDKNHFIIYFIYFDLTDCVRSVDLLLFTCLEDDWDKLMRLVQFYARDKAYLSQVSMSERLTVMAGSAYLFKMVRSALPQPPQVRHMHGCLCLCQFTEECLTRFVHALDREDVAALLDLFTRHLFGYVSGTTARRINVELFHRLQ